ncbi:MAG: DNA methyltransferase [Bermanella sp.]|uniref:type I restriction-modification system subunit M n=1 Tax=uncultured Pseudoalteromonas sp. TaxID=114053 RepID=UPI000C8D709A|nr:class I SAM-dependent DNA methyltransferase [uncultured Pseudoalteromonas sp.]MAA72384.1 DNA methyltransferase [Bermanella sp.]
MATKKQAAKKKEKSFEETLWDAANKLRGSVESSEYKHIVLSLIFLKFISDTFEKQRQKLIDSGLEKHVDMVPAYTKDNVFYLPENSRWSFVQQNAKQEDIALKIDTALSTIEKTNKALQGALPDNYFSRLGLDVSKLSALIDVINNIDTLANPHEDVVGRVYEYFLSKFAIAEGKGKGEFYTPKSIVNLIAELIEPYKGKIYDPCCGSGGMFVQSMKFIENHKGNKKDVSVYGQEYTGATYKLAKMNLAIRGISANLGAAAKDTFGNDQHETLKADFIMANPPFNQKDWRASDELVDDHRWEGYETPPTSNANYGWILHMVSKLSENGVAGFVLSNGALSDEGVEQKIRKKLIQDDLVEAIILLPRKLFYTTDIGVTLWILNKNKKSHTVADDSHTRNYRDRSGEVLFIDMRKCGVPFEKKYVDLTENELARTIETYHNWQQVDYLTSYSDIPEYCYSANLEEIERNDFSLVLNKYVEFKFSSDSYDFDGHLVALQAQVDEILEQEKAQKAEMFKNFKESGYELQA